MLSFWERNSLVKYDNIIIGAGITGLSVACELKEQYPDKSVLVLERGLLPTGASTKNAGFACIGSLSEKLSDIQLMGEEKLLQLVTNRWHGLQILRKRLGDQAIGFESYGGYELLFKNQDAGFLDKMNEVNTLLFPLFQKNIFSLQPDKISEFGFTKDRVQTLICNDVEGQIDTGKMMNALWQYSQKLGVRIICGAGVKAIEESNEQVKIFLDQIEFIADKIFICTNAFAKSLLPEIDLQPGRGQVIATAPIENLKVKGIFFFDEGYYYFRNFENRIIFGGGRNLDFEGETTTAFGSNQKILNQLNLYLREIILPENNFEIEQQWSGIMAFGGNKLPVVQQISDRQFAGLRLNGMGVALGSKIARDLVAMLKN